MSRALIIRVDHNGAERDFNKYWSVELQDPKTKTTYTAFWHNSEFRLHMFESDLLLKGTITEKDLDSLKDLYQDVYSYRRAMEESD